MAAGDIYNALTRNRNLEPVGDAISKFFKSKQDQSDLDEFWNLVKQTKSGISGATSPGPNIPNPHFQNKEPGPWSPEIATTQFDPVKAGSMVSDMTMNALQKFPGMNPAYINTANQLLEKGIQAQTPSYSTKEFDPTKGLEQIIQLPGQAPNIKTLRSGIEKKKLVELKPNPKTGTYWGIDQDGNPTDSKISYDTTPIDIAKQRLGLEKERVSIDRARLDKENPKEEQNIDKMLGDLKKEKILAGEYDKNLKGASLKKDRALKTSETSANIQGITQQLTSTLSRRYKNFDTEFNYLKQKGLSDEKAIEVFLKENRKKSK